MKALELSMPRISQGNGGTLGLLYLNGQFFCFTLEDCFRVVKVDGITRIPEGRYQIKFRKDDSPLTARYRAKYEWFDWHLELQNVPDFEHVYLHVGNVPDDTDGCILTGDTAENNQVAPAFIGKSASAFRRVYDVVAAALRAGQEVWISIETNERQPSLRVAATKGKHHEK